MKTLVVSFISGLLALGSAGVAAQEAESPHSWSGGVTLSTDYMYRGQSQTGNNPAVSGTVNYGYDTGTGMNLYAGTWASSINFGGNVEIDWYGGVTGSFGETGLNWDVGFLYYQYPGGDDLDFVEGHLGLSYAFAEAPGAPTVGFKVHYTPEWQLKADDGLYYEGNIGLSLPMEFGLAFHVGHQEVDDNATWGSPDWTEWNVYLSHKVVGPLTASVGYHDTDLSKAECFAGTNICDSRVVFTIGASF